MIKTDFMSLYEELSKLNESKEDIAKFIDKFGKDNYELFKKSAQRLKNKGISTDLTYHVKNTDKKDLDAILLNLQNRVITKDGSLTELAGDYKYLGEDKGYKVYKINDVIASINFGSGTGWCISGRYGHYGEKNYKPTKEAAEEHWDSYTEQGVQFYFFIGPKSKVALALYPIILTPKQVFGNTFISKTNCEIYNEQDDLDYSLFASLPIDLIDAHIVFEGMPAEKGLYIKDNVLIKCDRNLENVAIPYGITQIDDYAFYSCDQLKTVTIPDSVTSIGDSAFYGCCRLTSITIPNSVTYIGDWAFWGCESLTSITIPNSVTYIRDSVFSECDGLKSITIPNSVTGIGESAFSKCDGLTSVTIPNSVKSIGDWAFWSCDSLTSITIPNSVTSIGENAFSECSSLTSITIPNSVTSIGDYAFDGCFDLTNIVVDKNNPNYKVVDGHLYDKNNKMII